MKNNIKIKWKALIIAVIIPLAVGGIASLITSGAMQTFGALNQPPLSPPAWLFPVVWTLLYILMGVASYRIGQSTAYKNLKYNALYVYALQLFFNFGWPIIFFNLKAYLLAFFWLLALWVLIIITLVRFIKIDKVAGYLLIPYLLWVTFAAYLNLGIYVLNQTNI